MLTRRILRVDKTGYPHGWLNYEQAAILFARGLVNWTLGGEVVMLHGGFSRLLHRQSLLSLPAIIACDGVIKRKHPYRPCLHNQALFERDGFTCLYCGVPSPSPYLTRDHVVPMSRGGKDVWTNVVTACRRCNHHKGDRLLSELGMELLAVPYTPNRAEYLALINSRRILADQMEFLRSQFSSNFHNGIARRMH